MSVDNPHKWNFVYREQTMTLAQGIRYARELREQVKDLNETKTDRYTTLSLWATLVLSWTTVIASPLEGNLFVIALVGGVFFSFLIAASTHLLLQQHLSAKHRQCAKLDAKIAEVTEFNELLHAELTAYLNTVYAVDADSDTIDDMIYGSWTDMMVRKNGADYRCYSQLMQDDLILMDYAEVKEMSLA